MQKPSLQNFQSILLISAVTILGLFQVSFFIYTMKWDIMDQFFPCRYFISECFANHTMPLWCPYIYLGYPIYADPQAGLWYPISFLTALTFGYNVYVIQAEYILHLIIGALGVYKLLQTLHINRAAALVAAMVFPLCGFFISHASHLTWVISVAWMPYVFNYFILGFGERRYLRFMQSGMALALCLTGGYVVFPVLTCYALFFVFVYYLIKHKSEKGILFKGFQYGFVTAISFLLLSSGYLFSLLQSVPYLERTAGLTVEAASVNPFSPQCFLSFIFPFTAAAGTSFFDTDTTMRNMYMGLLLFPLITMGIAYGNRTRNLLLLAGAIFCFAAAAGEYLPVRGWLYHTLPFMKLFRHPAIFRSLALIIFIIIAANGLQVIYEKYTSRVKQVLIGTLLLEGILIGIIFFIAAQHETIKLRFPDFTTAKSVSDFNIEGNLYKHIIVQAAGQGILIAIILLLCFFMRGRILAISISFFWIVDLMLAAQMNVPTTVMSDVKASAFHDTFKKLPQGFPNSGNTPVGVYNQYGGEQLKPVIYNASILRKEPCSEGFNAFCLDDYIRFLSSPMAHYTLQQPMAFISPQIKPTAVFEEDIKNGIVNPVSLYAPDAVALTNAVITGSATLVEFNPGHVKITADADKPAFLTLLQANYPGWEATIDNKPTSIIKTNGTFMTITLPAGKHEILFDFRPRFVYVFAILQWAGYLAFVVILFYKRKNQSAIN